MLDSLVDRGAAIIQWDLRATVVVVILSGLILTRAVTSIRSNAALRRSGEGKTPPILPYDVPFLANVFAFAFDTKALLGKIGRTYGPNVPIRIRIASMKVHYISGAESVLALFKGSRDLTTVPSAILVLENAFGSPATDRHVYQRDNTGILEKPLPGSNQLEPHNRLFHINHKSLHLHLTGSVGLNELATRFMSHLEAELNALDIGQEWTTIPDFYTLVKQVIFKASTTAICGPTLFELNQDFVTDFWEFDTHVPNLFRGLPRLLIPSAFRIRDKLKFSIMKWHTFAAEKFDRDDEELQKQEWEELYGSRLMRNRQDELGGVDGYGAESRAANDLGMIWGANANIVPIVGWSLIDTLIRPELTSEVRNQVLSTMNTSAKGPTSLNMPKLVANPLLQSIYSEELRLRNGVIIQRVPVVDDFRIGSWKFPKGNMILASSWHEQRDRSVWNEGPVNGEFHSVEDFWAERFLVYPNNPDSGPAKPRNDSKSRTKTVDGEDQPKFTTESVTGSFIPYGGGQKICPGRFYAKQEAIGALAMFLTMFDIELEKDDLPQPDLAYFPFGVVPPIGKFPARMRRRKI